MKADKGSTTSSAPISVAERIAALQKGIGKSMSTCTSSTGHDVPTATAAQPPTAMSKRINALALARRIAVFQTTKSADNDRRDGGASDRLRDELDAEEVAVIKLDVDEEEKILNGCDNTAGQTENSCNQSASELPIFTYNVPLAGKMIDKSSEQKILPDTNSTSNNDSLSFDSLPAECLDSTWTLSPEKKCHEPVGPISSNAHLTGGMIDKSFTSEQKKLSDANAASNNVSMSFDSLPANNLDSTWNLSPGKCHETVEAVWSNVPLTGEVMDKSSTSEQKKLSDTNAASNNVSISFDSLPAEYLDSTFDKFSPSEQKKLSVSDTNVTSNVSISFDCLPREHLDSTWNLPPEDWHEPIEPVLPEELFVDKEARKATSVVEYALKKFTERLADEAEATVTESTDNMQGLLKIEPEVALVKEDKDEVKKELLTEDHLLKIQQTEEQQKHSLVSEATAALLARRAARLGKSKVTKYQLKLQAPPQEESMNLSGITTIAPDESFQSDLASILEDDSLDEQERYLQNQSIDSITLQNVASECVNTTQLLTNSVDPMKVLVEAILSLGVLADTFAEGCNFIASEIQDNPRSS